MLRIHSLFVGWLVTALAVQAQTTGTIGGGTTGAPTTGGGTGSFGGGLGQVGQGTAAPKTTAGGGASSAAAIPSTYNPYKTTYVNPLAQSYVSPYTATVSTATIGSGEGNTSAASQKLGSSVGNGVPTVAFGQPLFAVTGTKTTTVTSTQTLTTPAGYSTVGQRKAPLYTTGLSEDIPIVLHNPGILASELNAIIQRSTKLNNRQNIRVSVENGVVVLRGSVPTAREKRLSEALIRLTPGVRLVANQIDAPAEPIVLDE